LSVVSDCREVEVKRKKERERKAVRRNEGGEEKMI
jgi:hypothetical protein